jgi:predicted transcriptional regulator
MAAKRRFQEMTVGLNEGDRGRLFEIARRQNRTKTEVARDAISWLLGHYDEIQEPFERE